MANDIYKEALEKEISLLKEENAKITEHIRPQAMEAMNTKSPDDIIKRVSIGFFAKRIIILIIALTLIAGASLIIGSFINEMSTPYAEDISIKDPSFTPDTTEGFNQTGSTTAHPKAAVQNGIYYFSDGAYIYKYINGESITVTEGDATHLNAYKYCLYYYDSSERVVYRIRTDGKEKTALIRNVSATDVKVYNNTLYVLTEDGDIHKIYINGKNGYLFKEGENILSFTVTNGYIYYVRKDADSLAIYRSKISTGDTVKVSDTDSTLLTAGKDHLFYIYNGTLYGLNHKEEKAHAFFAGSVKEFVLLNETLLVLDKDTIYAVDTTGRGIEKIAENIGSMVEIPLTYLIRYTGEGQADK
jgi:hypothetical protein